MVTLYRHASVLALVKTVEKILLWRFCWGCFKDFDLRDKGVFIGRVISQSDSVQPHPTPPGQHTCRAAICGGEGQEKRMELVV